MHQCVSLGSPMGRPNGFWHLIISAKVSILVCTFVSESPGDSHWIWQVYEKHFWIWIGNHQKHLWELSTIIFMGGGGVKWMGQNILENLRGLHHFWTLTGGWQKFVFDMLPKQMCINIMAQPLNGKFSRVLRGVGVQEWVGVRIFSMSSKGAWKYFQSQNISPPPL